MEINRINHSTSFGARNVVVDAGLEKLGKKVVLAVKEALPEAYKLGDDSIDLDYCRLGAENIVMIIANKVIKTVVEPEKKTGFSKFLSLFSAKKPPEVKSIM